MIADLFSVITMNSGNTICILKVFSMAYGIAAVHSILKFCTTLKITYFATHLRIIYLH